MPSLSWPGRALPPGTTPGGLHSRRRPLLLPTVPDARPCRPQCQPESRAALDRAYARTFEGKASCSCAMCEEGAERLRYWDLPGCQTPTWAIYRCGQARRSDQRARASPRGTGVGWVRLSQIVRPHYGFTLSSGYATCLTNPTTAPCQKLRGFIPCGVSLDGQYMLEGKRKQEAISSKER